MYGKEYSNVDTIKTTHPKQTISNFIVFEGIDGSGKSTQLKMLEKNIHNSILYAKKDNINVVEPISQEKNTAYTYEDETLAYVSETVKTVKSFFTAEPTNLHTGKFLRSILKGEIEAHPSTVVHLFAADRAEHLYAKGGIIERCTNGELCVCDRYLFSNLAYQGVTCGMELPVKLNDNFPLPELVLYFDINPQEALKRAQSRGEAEIYEKIDFLQKTHDQYNKVFERYENMIKQAVIDMKIVRIDASLSQEEIAAIVWTNVEPLVNLL